MIQIDKQANDHELKQVDQARRGAAVALHRSSILESPDRITLLVESTHNSAALIVDSLASLMPVFFLYDANNALPH